MFGFDWQLFITVSFVSREPVALINTYSLDLKGYLEINKFQSA